MACAGFHCTNHNTGTTTCVGHRGACATNRPLSVSGDFGVHGARIRASDANNVRANIRNELARWNQHAWYNFTLRQASGYGVGTVVTDVQVEELRMMVADVKSLSYFSDRNGLPIENIDWSTGIRSVYDDLRNDCICNTDCSCNAICACHNDCGCNYSDERLKVDIEFL